MRRAAGALLLLAALARSAGAADDTSQFEFFENKIRPVLADNCYPCHSTASGKSKGGLLLDSKDALRQGGDSGPAIVPGDAPKSLLIRAVSYTDPDLKMPPKNKRLAAADIAALEAWVKMGAPDPRTNAPAGSFRARAKTHWAFQPVSEPPVPAVKHQQAVRSPVDNFVLAKLEAARLTLSPAADKRTLIRRATFDLTGLPPTMEEVTAFERDKSPDAFAKVVDRLLASPRYGERWGRHWLDTARYADTKGYVFEEDRHYGYAYTYRDYVIRAFNDDLPYDLFLKQQIAADLLPGGDKQSLAALGYLTLGRRFLNNEQDIIDDRIDVVCRGMMALTVTCARCHDHKFDPIPQKDYYSLYGIFSSSTEPEIEPLLGKVPPGKVGDDYTAERKKRVEARENYIATERNAVAAKLRLDTGKYLAAADAASRTNSTMTDSIAHASGLDPEVLHRWMTGLDGWKASRPEIFGPWFAFAAIPEKEFAARAQETNAALQPGNALVAKAFTCPAPVSMKEVAERYGKVFHDIDAQWAKISTNSPPPKALADANAEALRQILYAEGAPANLPRAELDRLFETPVLQRTRELGRSIAELDATSPGAAPRAMAMEDRPDPHDVNVFLRGNSGNQGELAPRRFLEVVAGPHRPVFTHGSGRLELAESVADAKNPLTARVFVNRVWMHHFGTPLVATPGDFGLRSDPPSNPQLLDYLAARFVASGWSVKQLHRLIMRSAAYQQSSADNPAAAKIDPNNILYWRMNRQRLEFEPLRDTLLAVAGKIDLAVGGQPVDILDPGNTRRTVYGFIDRQNLPDLFRAFDLASPDSTSARRFFTTVPQQALFLMNSPFMETQAENFADRPEFKSATTDPNRVKALYRAAYQRDPTPEEIKWAHDYVEGNPARWQTFAQALLMSNELVFAD